MGESVALSPEESAELEALASDTGIADWLKMKSDELAAEGGGQALAWASSQLFSSLGLGDKGKTKQIVSLLKQVVVLEDQILVELKDLLQEIQFQGLITRGFGPVERIKNTYEQFIGTSEGRMDQIIEDILDTNEGIALDLATIHDVLVGNNNPLSPGSPGILTIFMDRWKASFLQQQLQPNVPLEMLPVKSNAYLHGLFMIQYMGVSLLANVYLKNGDQAGKDNLASALKLANDRLAKQTEIVNSYIPEWVRSGAYKGFLNGHVYVIWAALEPNEVMYGPLPNTLEQIQFRGRHPGNGDEEWTFTPAPSGQTDTFYLGVESRGWWISEQDDLIYVDPPSEHKIPLQCRFILAPNGDTVRVSVIPGHQFR